MLIFKSKFATEYVIAYTTCAHFDVLLSISTYGLRATEQSV